jgi:hypothetical protein
VIAFRHSKLAFFAKSHPDFGSKTTDFVENSAGPIRSFVLTGSHGPNLARVKSAIGIGRFQIPRNETA